MRVVDAPMLENRESRLAVASALSGQSVYLDDPLMQLPAA